MKILHITQNYEPSRGGTQYMIKKVSEYLTQIYHDTVTVYTTNSYYGPNRNIFRKIDKQEEFIGNVYVKRFPFIRLHKPVLAYYSRIFRKRLPSFFYELSCGPLSPSMKSAMMRHDCDVIAASSIQYLFTDYPRWEKKRKKPFVLLGGLHIQNDSSILSSYIKRIKHSDYYIANTGFEKQFLITQGIEDYKIKVIGAGTDIFQYETQLLGNEILKSKYGISEEHYILLYIGRQESSKGLDCLIKAYENLKKNIPVSLIIAGARGSYSEQIERISKENNSIYVLNDISDIEKAELLKIADILVLPSEQESFGIVFLESWSFKKPVIGANIGAVASIIDNEKDGLLFQANNVDDLEKKIRTLLQNALLRSGLGCAGYEKVMKYYTWPIIASKFRNVYELAIESFQKHRTVENENLKCTL
jgi:glycosyltransferase involved in cell wall biosynthesis